MTPSQKPYTGPRHTPKEDLPTLVARIDNLDQKTVATELAKYKDTIP